MRNNSDALHDFVWTSFSASQRRLLWTKVGEKLNRLYFSLSYVVAIAMTYTGKTADELTADDIRRTTDRLIGGKEKEE